MYGDDPLDTRLRRRMETRIREQFQAAESEAVILAARQKRMPDVAWEASQAGCMVRVLVGRRRLEGVPVYVRNDLMTLDTQKGRAEVCLPGVDGLAVLPASREGRPESNRVETFLSRMGMLQLTEHEFDVVCRGGHPDFTGKIGWVARDHLALVTAVGRIHVALDRVAYVMRRTTPL